MANSSNVIVQCGNCRQEIDENASAPVQTRRPCPNCGATSRHISVSLTATVTARSKLMLKARRPGLKRPFIEQVSGDDLHLKTGRWMVLRRVIDRARNWYYELVTDPETGQVVHECDEPLTEHRGQRSARPPRASDA